MSFRKVIYVGAWALTFQNSWGEIDQPTLHDSLQQRSPDVEAARFERLTRRLGQLGEEVNNGLNRIDQAVNNMMSLFERALSVASGQTAHGAAQLLHLQTTDRIGHEENVGE